MTSAASDPSPGPHSMTWKDFQRQRPASARNHAAMERPRARVRFGTVVKSPPPPMPRMFEA